MEARLGEYNDMVEERLKLWQGERFVQRLFERDIALWSLTPLPEITDRLGWLTLPETSHKKLDEFNAFSREVKREGISHCVLLGMGGSSLAPQVFMHTFGNVLGCPKLIVLDSTHPMAVKSVESKIKLKGTLFIVSSKSGTTIETLSLFRYFWQRALDTVDSPNRHFAAITDPETPLERLARERDFVKVFFAPPDVGGRFSALSVFGLLPAALIGVDIHRLLGEALIMKEGCFSREGETPCLGLGALLGELALMGRDKITFFTSPSLDAFPDWLEQLIAESTGKDGKGIVPIVGEPIGAPEVYGDDRLFVYILLKEDDTFGISEGLKVLEEAGHPVVKIELADKSELGQEIFRWEAATASAGSILGIHPFNQPDVEIAKRLAREAMDERLDIKKDSGYPSISIEKEAELKDALGAIFEGVKGGDYVALQAYLAPAQHITASLQKIRIFLRDRLKIATTLGFGPRYLHSTGQLHKGGPDSGIFLQLIDEPEEDLPIPETDYTFKTLIQAQALGDYQALKQRGRRTIRINLGRDVDAGLKRLVEVIGEIC